MGYQALYRKYRPRTFDDVAGQEHITKTLKNQVATGRTSHAYLFVGTRGTGKTTCAKILSRAINCENPREGNPCNECSSCVAIESDLATDVLEIDAASNNGVDNVRDLRDEAVFTPAALKRRVYIIDEVHMLSVAAFNALLKILEEPPAHLLFILATTELHKVPATILSRCQRFSFRRLSREDITLRLEHIAALEGFTLDKKGAELIARLSDGSMRDGVSLLDQCSGVSLVDKNRVTEVLGLPAEGETLSLINAIADRDAKTCFLIADQLYMAGKQMSALFDEITEIMRDILISHTVSDDIISGTLDKEELKRLGKKLPPARTVYILKTASDARESFTRGSRDRIRGEIAIAQMCDESLEMDISALAARLEGIENSLKQGEYTQNKVVEAEKDITLAKNTSNETNNDVIAAKITPEVDVFSDKEDDDLPPWDIPEPKKAKKKTRPVERAFPDADLKEEKNSSPPQKDQTPQAPPKRGSEDDVWHQIMDGLPIPISATIQGTQAEIKGNILIISASSQFIISFLETESTQKAIEEETMKITGKQVAIRAVLDETPAETKATEKIKDIKERFADLIEYEE